MVKPDDLGEPNMHSRASAHSEIGSGFDEAYPVPWRFPGGGGIRALPEFRRLHCASSLISSTFLVFHECYRPPFYHFPHIHQVLSIPKDSLFRPEGSADLFFGREITSLLYVIPPYGDGQASHFRT